MDQDSNLDDRSGSQAPAGMAAAPRSGRVLLILMLLGMACRLGAMLYTQPVDSDGAQRIWIAWRWLGHPGFITDSVWGPLHTYMIAAALWLTGDPFLGPMFMQSLVAVVGAVPVYRLTAEEFDPRQAATVAAFWLFYPALFRNSLMAMSEVPCAVLLATAMLWIARSRRAADGRLQAAIGGLSLTLAGMLRYETWLLIPLFGLALWKKRRCAASLAVVASAFPVFWMYTCWRVHGDPLYSINFARDWQLQVDPVGLAYDASSLMGRSLYFPIAAMAGMCPLVGALVVAGGVRALSTRARQCAWLIPGLGLVVGSMAGCMSGSMLMRMRYTLLAGALLLPFAALGIRTLSALLPRWSRIPLAWLVVGAMLPLAGTTTRHCGTWLPIKGSDWETEPIPRLEAGSPGPRLGALVRGALAPGDGLVSDFYGWRQTYYVLLCSRLPFERLWVAPGGLHQEADIGWLQATLARCPTGLLLLKDGSPISLLVGPDGRIRGTSGIASKLELVPMFKVGDVRLLHYQVHP